MFVRFLEESESTKKFFRNYLTFSRCKKVKMFSLWKNAFHPIVWQFCFSWHFWNDTFAWLDKMKYDFDIDYQTANKNRNCYVTFTNEIMKISTHLSWKHLVSYIIIVIIVACFLCSLGFLNFLSFLLCCFPAECFNLFVTSKNEFKVLQNVFKIKKQSLKCFLK